MSDHDPLCPAAPDDEIAREIERGGWIMTDHDPLCSANGRCRCWLIAQVRADERQRIARESDRSDGCAADDAEHGR